MILLNSLASIHRNWRLELPVRGLMLVWLSIIEFNWLLRRCVSLWPVGFTLRPRHPPVTIKHCLASVHSLPPSTKLFFIPESQTPSTQILFPSDVWCVFWRKSCEQTTSKNKLIKSVEYRINFNGDSVRVDCFLSMICIGIEIHRKCFYRLCTWMVAINRTHNGKWYRLLSLNLKY